MDSTPLQLFKEISQMSKEFRHCILHSMPKEYRFDIGSDIRDQGSDNQIFFDIDGKRVWIQGGIFISEER